MRQLLAEVTEVERITSALVVLRLRAPALARESLPGQFANIRVDESWFPLLRRPFSFYRTSGDSVEFLFSVVGAGTSRLAAKLPGEAVDLIGPLGRPFSPVPQSTTAILVGGGLGVAPLPLLHERLRAAGCAVETFLGARSAEFIVRRHLGEVTVATDDGSEGFRGTIVECLRPRLAAASPASTRIFACGPTPMLKALCRLAEEYAIPCEVSLESAMACGFGICQGCPVELKSGPKKFALICKEGTVFDSSTILLP